MTPTVFGYSVIVLGGVGFCSWVGMFIGARTLRKQLVQKSNIAELWHSEANRMAREIAVAETRIDRLEIDLDLRTADLIRCQNKLQKYKRVQGPGGKFIGRAK